MHAMHDVAMREKGLQLTALYDRMHSSEWVHAISGRVMHQKGPQLTELLQAGHEPSPQQGQDGGIFCRRQAGGLQQA